MKRLPQALVVVLDLLLAPVLLCATAWVRRRQSAILRDGVALTPEQRALAQALGIVSVGRVRVVAAPEVPLPLPRFACNLVRRARLISPHIAGMTLGYGIVLREDCCNDLRLLAHELAHVAQYERLGGLRGFLRQYLRECVWPGYPLGELEVQARCAEARGSTRGADVIPYSSTATDHG